MFVRWINSIRCQLTSWVLRRPWASRYALARHMAPSTTSLVAHRRRHPPPLRLPPRSHLIYHQHTVDAQAARNSIASLAAQIPQEDEVVFLDITPTSSPDWIEPFRNHEWTGYTACQAKHPEQRSYTYGLNTGMAALKAPWLFVWRTDYVYPAGVMDAYLRQLPAHDFAVPYRVWIGKPEVDAGFLLAHHDRFAPFDADFWSERSHVCSLYETQDCALFAIRRSLWDRIGGLNHELWGYGWQFAEFAARVRAAVPDRRISYFDCPPPLHQTHEGTMMHLDQLSDEKASESNRGIDRFARFLGGKAAMESYRLRQHLPPRPPQ